MLDMRKYLDRAAFFGVRPREAALGSGDASPLAKNWPHAPVHYLSDAGIYMVTAGTYQKNKLLNSPGRLELVMRALFKYATEFNWQLHAWAVMANHYHFVAKPELSPLNLSRFVAKLHMTTSKDFNERDKTPGRKVWFQYWESIITFERSYLARVNYVNQNPVYHGLVSSAELYRWGSAAWFERTAPLPFVKAVKSMRIEGVRVPDDF